MISFRLTAVALTATLAGCMSSPPSVYKAVGATENKTVVVSISRPSPVKGTTASVSIDGEQILNTKRYTRILKNPNCQRLSALRYSCEDTGTYKGESVRVIEEWSTNRFAGYAHFDIYVGGKLLQRVEAVAGY